MDNSDDTNPIKESEKVNVKELLSEDIRDHKILKNYETVDAMAKSLINAQELVGKRVDALSGEDLHKLKPELFAPSHLDGYKFEADDQFKKEALELGLNETQAKRLLEKRSKISEELKLKRDEDIELSKKALQVHFGSKYEAGMEVAQKAALELGGDDLYNGVFGDNGSFDPNLIKALSEAGKRLFDHESIQVAKTPAMGLDDVNIEISKLLTKENRQILGNVLDPRGKAIQERLKSLYEKRAKLKG